MKRNTIVPILAACVAVIVVLGVVSTRPRHTGTSRSAVARASTAQGSLTATDVSIAAGVVKEQLGGNVLGAKASAVVSTYGQYMDVYADGAEGATTENALFATQVLVISLAGDLSTVVTHHPIGSSGKLGRRMMIVVERTTGKVLSRKIEGIPDNGIALTTPEQQAQFSNLSALGGTPEDIPLT